eukprot:scpid44272/ scgid13447/ Probable E3 ubiquitin-protein ligase C12orf51
MLSCFGTVEMQLAKNEKLATVAELPCVPVDGLVLGFGWRREEPAAAAAEAADNGGVDEAAGKAARPVTGTAYFTRNGERFGKEVPGVLGGGQYPFLSLHGDHILAHVNFGQEPFAYAEGHAAQEAAHTISSYASAMDDIMTLMRELPFFGVSLPRPFNTCNLDNDAGDGDDDDDLESEDVSLHQSRRSSASSFYTPLSRKSPADAATTPPVLAAASASNSVDGGAASSATADVSMTTTVGTDFLLPPAWGADNAAASAYSDAVDAMATAEEKPDIPASIGGADSAAAGGGSVTAADDRVRYRPLSPGDPCLQGVGPNMLHTGHSMSASALLGHAHLAKDDHQERKEREAASSDQAERDHRNGGGPDVEAAQSTDPNTLLLTAWEKKVFPIIRSRFRNNDERTQGLGQIRGALSMGLFDIAQSTVEFLYEEGGGMPPNLQFPTLESVKAELNKFDINRVRKGSSVLIGPEDYDDGLADGGDDGASGGNNSADPAPGTAEHAAMWANVAPTTVANPAAVAAGNAPASADTMAGAKRGGRLPGFAVAAMVNTIGLIGIVTNIDKANQLIELEVYIREEGVIASFWYPASFLRRAPTEQSGDSAMTSPGDMTINVHRELVKCEHSLSALYCRWIMLVLTAQRIRRECKLSLLPQEAFEPFLAGMPHLPGCIISQALMTTLDTAAQPGATDTAKRLLTEFVWLVGKSTTEHASADCVRPLINITQVGSGSWPLRGLETLLPDRLAPDCEALKQCIWTTFADPQFAVSLQEQLLQQALQSMDLTGTTTVLKKNPAAEGSLPSQLDWTGPRGTVALVVSCHEKESCVVGAKPPGDKKKDKRPLFARVFAEDSRLGLRTDGRPQFREVVRYPNVMDTPSSSAGSDHGGEGGGGSHVRGARNSSSRLGRGGGRGGGRG